MLEISLSTIASFNIFSPLEKLDHLNSVNLFFFFFLFLRKHARQLIGARGWKREKFPARMYLCLHSNVARQLVSSVFHENLRGYAHLRKTWDTTPPEISYSLRLYASLTNCYSRRYLCNAIPIDTTERLFISITSVWYRKQHVQLLRV